MTNAVVHTGTSDAERVARCAEAVLIGTAVGDSIGLPYEGLSPRRARRLFGGAPLRHRLLFGRGMVSDDTDHTWMTAEALVASGGDPESFARSLAWRLRFWLFSLPAGVGLATGRAIIKLWLGFPPSRSGVWSAGNGPAMRAAILGVYAVDDAGRLGELVRASTRLTHTDPDAERGALAVALAATYATRLGAGPVDAEDLSALFRRHLNDTAILPLLEEAIAAARDRRSIGEFLRGQGLDDGVSGYINHTVPAAIFCWLRWSGDFRTAVEQVVLAGGDTDSTAAIVGALAAISAGTTSIPAEWLDRLVLWPRTVGHARTLAHVLACSGRRGSRIVEALRWLGTLPRNIVFLAVVLVHGFRRLMPPY